MFAPDDIRWGAERQSEAEAVMDEVSLIQNPTH